MTDHNVFCAEIWKIVHKLQLLYGHNFYYQCEIKGNRYFISQSLLAVRRYDKKKVLIKIKD